MNPRGYTILPSAPPPVPHTAIVGTAPPALASASASAPALALCYACRLYLSDPLLMCGCGCRIPIHPTCYTALSLRNEECPVCRRSWAPLSSNRSPPNLRSSAVSVSETIAEHPLSHTECAPSCSMRWMLYSLVCFVIGIGALFLFFYFIK